MKIVGMSEWDLNGVLFMEFPPEVPLQESRDMLELLIADVYDLDFAGLEEDEIPEMVISPFNVMRALGLKFRREWDKMSDEERRPLVAEAVAWRNKRFAEMGGKPRLGLDKRSGSMVDLQSESENQNRNEVQHAR